MVPVMDTKQNDYAREAEERWGNTRAWKESRERTKGMGKADWDALKAEMAAILDGAVQGMERGPEDEQVQAAVRAYHEFIDRRFYTCSAAMFGSLADLWGEDPRFGAYWDSLRPGMTEFIRAAVAVYLDRLLLESEERL